MSLTPSENAQTRAEFEANLALTGLTLAQVSRDLETNQSYIEDLLRLNPRDINHPWILRNYLLQKVEEMGKEPVPFTALRGRSEDYWFLDSRLINEKKIGW